jgi:hypothetical protein
MTRHRSRQGYLRRGTGAGLAVVVALLAAGCDSEPQAAEPTPTPTIEPTETAQPTPPRLPTPDPTEDPTPLAPPGDPEPELATTGEDVDAVLRSNEAYRSWLFRNPHPENPERLARIAHPDCNCWEPDQRLLTHYAENELWWTGAVLQPRHVEVLDRSAQNVATVGVVYERDGQAQLIDRTGTVHDELEPRAFYAEVVLRREDAGSPWLVVSVSDARPVPERYSDAEEG